MIKVTTSHDEIKRWAKKYHAVPCILNKKKIAFFLESLPLFRRKKSLISISWEKFFRTFEEEQLAFEYDTEENSTTHDCKFIKRSDMRH